MISSSIKFWTFVWNSDGYETRRSQRAFSFDAYRARPAYNEWFSDFPENLHPRNTTPPIRRLEIDLFPELKNLQR